MYRHEPKPNAPSGILQVEYTSSKFVHTLVDPTKSQKGSPMIIESDRIVGGSAMVHREDFSALRRPRLCTTFAMELSASGGEVMTGRWRGFSHLKTRLQSFLIGPTLQLLTF